MEPCRRAIDPQTLDPGASEIPSSQAMHKPQHGLAQCPPRREPFRAPEPHPHILEPVLELAAAAYQMLPREVLARAYSGHCRRYRAGLEEPSRSARPAVAAHL